MSGNPASPYSPDAQPPKKNKTCLIVVIVLAAIGIPAICVCGGVVAMYFSVQQEVKNIALDDWEMAEEAIDDMTWDEAEAPSDVAAGDPNYFQVPAGLWQLTESSPGRFSAMLPGVSDHTSQITNTDVGKIEMHIHSASIENEQAAFLIMYNDYPDELIEQKDPDDILRDAANGVTDGHRDGSLKNTVFQQAGHPGRDLTFIRDEDNSSMYYSWRLYVVKNRLYQIGILGTNKPVSPQAIKMVHDSFEFTLE